jgi:hypothetical protein
MMVALDILIMVFALAYFFWQAAEQHDRDEAAERARAARTAEGGDAAERARAARAADGGGDIERARAAT